jgi:cation diffusion facilitator CzcD-associated flavoprotein CzcO
VRDGADHVDVLIVGAGLSGVAAAWHLRERCPAKTFAILEARDVIGGTWDLFRYPGVRSDSDMYTLGYSFRPWTSGRSFADGPSIRSYVRETAAERGIEPRIRFGHRVLRAAWSSADARWTVEAERVATGETVRLTCGFLFACTGYYRYDAGHTPTLPGIENFRGRVVHPQAWPDDVEYADRQVVVVGSGATAVTLVPVLAERAAHVTMLQRSPSYVMSLPGEDALAARLRRRLPPRVAHTTIRWKNVLITRAIYTLSRRAPGRARAVLRGGAAARLPAGYPVDVHFNPRYDPWDQRLCLVPDGDLFAAIAQGRASVVTDAIAGFSADRVELASGASLQADLLVTATGLTMLAVGGIALSVDGRDVDLADTVAYRGLMLGGVPNFALAMGYTNASWTLRCELVARYVCRLLDHMDAHGVAIATPRIPAGPTQPLLTLTSGYVRRAAPDLPRQGARDPWRIHQDYLRERRLLLRGPVTEGMDFASVPKVHQSVPQPALGA